MRTKATTLLAAGMLLCLALVLSACGAAAPGAGGQEQLTDAVQTAVAATGVAETEMAATVAAAVEETVAAQPTATETGADEATPTTAADVATPTAAAVEATPTAAEIVQEQAATEAPEDPAPTAEPATAPEPTAMPETEPTALPDASTMSEEELAALIDEAVAEAVAASEDVTTTTDQVASDGSISEAEIEEIEALLAESDELIALAYDLMDMYYDVYSYADEALAVLTEMEDDLAYITTSLDSIAKIMVQGSEAATQAIAELEIVLADAGSWQQAAQAKNDVWMMTVDSDTQQRIADALAFAPNEIASDRAAAIQSATAYLEGVKGGLADQIITAEELAAISQQGANAVASIQSAGGRQLEKLAQPINDLTAQLAGGELPAARAGLAELEGVLAGLR